MVIEGWEYIVPISLRKRRPKIFMADDPTPGAMNKLFTLDCDLRREPSVFFAMCGGAQGGGGGTYSLVPCLSRFTVDHISLSGHEAG